MISRNATAPAPQTATAWTEASIHKDFADWRKGRTRYAVWVIDLDLPVLAVASKRMRRHLEPYLLAQYERQPHITLGICGFPGADNGFDDDYTPELFKAQIGVLKGARLQAFSVRIGSPGTFASAAYFSVHDDEGGIARVRQALGSDGPGEKDFPYVPHVTFGLYGGQYRVTDLLQRMRAGPDLMTTNVAVGRLVLMTYEAAVITGPLTAVCEFDLERQAARILDAGAMDALLR